MIVLGLKNKRIIYRGTTPIMYTYKGDHILIDQLGPANNEIWYTSTDGNIVNPDQEYFDATIVSNTYSGEKGIIKFDTDLTKILNGYRGGFLDKIYGAFAHITNISSIEIPNSVTIIGVYAFYECSGLTSIVIPDSVTSIGDDAFENCGLTGELIIPDSVTSIGIWSFAGCTGLTSVIIGNGIINIQNMAFQYCTGLTSVTIPNSVTRIGSYTFRGCESLTFISYTGTISQYNSITKESDWHYNVPATVVHCTDGDTPI